MTPTQPQLNAFIAEAQKYAIVDDAGNGEFIIHGVVNVRDALSAALAVPSQSSPGVDTAKFKGVVFVVHPDMPPHYWDGETMRRVTIGETTI